jgi:hypothetical protein
MADVPAVWRGVQQMTNDDPLLGRLERYPRLLGLLLGVALLLLQAGTVAAGGCLAVHGP